MLRIMLFGSVSASLCYNGLSRTLQLSPQLTSLLAFLALGRGREFQRNDLVELLWGEGDSDVAQGALNTALWRLRKLIERPPAHAGEYLSMRRCGAVGLNGPGAVELDAGDFERLAHASITKPLHQLTAADLDDMRTAASLYTGDILGELHSAWALRERERLRRLYLDLLGRLMQASALQGDHESAIRHAQAILYVDVLREDVHRDLMRYFVLNGQRASALRQYERCRAQLREELAIQPMRETLELYRRIADSAIAQPELESSLYPGSGPAPGMARGSAEFLLSPPDLLNAPALLLEAKAPSEHITAARRLIAQADTHLQLSLGRSER